MTAGILKKTFMRRITRKSWPVRCGCRRANAVLRILQRHALLRRQAQPLCRQQIYVRLRLAVPHLARAIVGPNYKALLPTSMFVGAFFLLVIDDIARVALSVEIPIGILTAIVGVPFFVVIFRNQMRGWR